MVWKILAGILAAVIAGQLIIPRVRNAVRIGRYPKLGILGGLLFAMMFACLIALFFIEDDHARLVAITMVGGFAVTGGALLMTAELVRRK